MDSKGKSAQQSRQDREVKDVTPRTNMSPSLSWRDELPKHLKLQQLMDRNKKQLQRLKEKREKVSALESQIKAIQNELKGLASEVKQLGKELEKTECESRDKRSPQEVNIKHLGIKIKIEKLEERLKESALSPGTLMQESEQTLGAAQRPRGPQFRPSQIVQQTQTLGAVQRPQRIWMNIGLQYSCQTQASTSSETPGRSRSRR
ncbi:hypothetical protein JOB18_034690 [Solea senegalensis]|nr:hypothetical protein JOB18_034690 [Solea senegalensis]